jgi:DNA repair photolyase
VRVVANPPNPWRSSHVDLLEPEPLQPVQVLLDDSKSILSRNDSPDVPFSWSVNPYRGCHHGCAYCYARPTHQWLDMGAGTDFERKLIVKPDAPQLLRQELRAREVELRGEMLAFSGVTDCYQPLEASYGITRQCLEVCRDHRQRVGIITKGALVERDRELLAEVHRRAGAFVYLSVPNLDEQDARALEPYASTPQRRLRAMQALAAAGVPVGVAIAPVIPGWNDHQIAAILQAAKAHGAESAFLILLRLPREVEDVFVERLRANLPERADKVLAALSEMRGGEGIQETRFQARMQGKGARWEAVQSMFAIWCKKLGLRTRERTHEPIAPPRQRGLFGD